jgi:hypothetical protein
MPDTFNELGMNRRIPRRDFLNGVAVGLVTAPLAAAADADTESAVYPPLQSHLRGNIPSAIAEFDHIRAGKYAQFPVSDSEIDEEYDGHRGRRYLRLSRRPFLPHCPGRRTTHPYPR